MNNGWRSTYSIKVDSIGNFILRKLNHAKDTNYYIGKLTDSVRNELVILIDSIYKQPYDSIYDQPCIDCGGSKVVVTPLNNATKIKIHIVGRTFPKGLEKLPYFLMDKNKIKNLIQKDTLYNFESSINLIPPQMETIKFTPPVVEDEEK